MAIAFENVDSLVGLVDAAGGDVNRQVVTDSQGVLTTLVERTVSGARDRQDANGIRHRAEGTAPP